MTSLFANLSADEIIQKLESLELGWSPEHTPHLLEVRIWDWPDVVGRYRPSELEPLADMLRKALASVGWDWEYRKIQIRKRREG